MLLFFTVLFLVCYGALIFYYYYHWRQLKEPVANATASLFISVIVAARNEEEQMERLLQSLKKQTYPAQLFEIIIVDDFSTDATAAIVNEHVSAQIKLVHPEISPLQSSKKKAIETGIHHAQGDLLVITDADCLVLPGWLQTIAGFRQQTGAVFIASPVKFISHTSLLNIFQCLDFITLQGITAASVQAGFHSMCNGANLAYTKEAFLKAEGFKGIDQVASGDDMLLMYKIWKKNPEKVLYLKHKNAIVATEAMPTWKQFLQQRIRWSSKAAYYDDYRVMLVLLFVYLFNCWFLVLLVATFFKSVYGWYLLLFLAAKTLIEWPLVASVSRFYNEQKLMKYFAFFQPLHMVYVVSVGFISQFGKYEWKGRRTK